MAAIREGGGELYAVSSEPQTLAGRASADWGLDFETVGDPHHEIAATCRERGWLDLYFNERLGFLKQSAGDPADWTPTHPKGYFQPGVLVLSREGRVLYRWRGVPTHQNMGGATERPTARYVWEQVQAALAEPPDAGDARLDTAPKLDSRGIPWPVFSTLLIANGWFLRPQGFRSPRHLIRAAARLVTFVAAWIAAFAWLPALPVALALASWVAFITPKFVWVGREFQSVSPDATSTGAPS